MLPPALPEETIKVDVYLSECRCLQPGPKSPAWIRQWSQALAVPEDAATYVVEISKFLATVALILATGLILLMAG